MEECERLCQDKRAGAGRKAPGKREKRPLRFAQAAGELRGWGGILRKEDTLGRNEEGQRFRPGAMRPLNGGVTQTGMPTAGERGNLSGQDQCEFEAVGTSGITQRQSA